MSGAWPAWTIPLACCGMKEREKCIAHLAMSVRGARAPLSRCRSAAPTLPGCWNRRERRKGATAESDQTRSLARRAASQCAQLLDRLGRTVAPRRGQARSWLPSRSELWLVQCALRNGERPAIRAGTTTLHRIPTPSVAGAVRGWDSLAGVSRERRHRRAHRLRELGRAVCVPAPPDRCRNRSSCRRGVVQERHANEGDSLWLSAPSRRQRRCDADAA
jgi:hypothetical protein